mgnify:CR=1 FL=1
MELHGDLTRARCSREGTPAEIAQYRYDNVPAEDPFWQVRPGDPGTPNQFHLAIYHRGAMTLQALRTTVGGGAVLNKTHTTRGGAPGGAGASD